MISLQPECIAPISPQSEKILSLKGYSNLLETYPKPLFRPKNPDWPSGLTVHGVHLNSIPLYHTSYKFHTSTLHGA
jgi:hypothetical protein